MKSEKVIVADITVNRAGRLGIFLVMDKREDNYYYGQKVYFKGTRAECLEYLTRG